MKKYGVSIPIAGYIYKEIEAESEDDAIEKVMSDGYENDDIIETDMYYNLVEGNVCYASVSSASAEEIEE